MVSAVCGGIRVASLYAPNGRVVGSPFYDGKLRWFERLSRWLAETRSPNEPLVLGGDYNVTPSDDDVWDAVAAHGGTHVSEPEREALARLRGWGLEDAYRRVQPARGRFSWWDYRAGMFHETRACGSTCCTPPHRLPRGSSGRRSTGRPARDPRRRRTTRRS